MPESTHFLVYTFSSLVEQTTPVAHRIFGAFATVSAITFTDKDLDSGDIGGTVIWTAPAATDRVELYRMYLALAKMGVGKSMVGEDVAAGTNLALTPTETPMADRTHFVVYTKSILVEQTTPGALLFVDNEAIVSNIAFPDFDLDLGDIGGILHWQAPSDTTQVTHYNGLLAI